MNRDKVKEILDKTNIYVLDEADIIEYIDELENKINKSIEYIEKALKDDYSEFMYMYEPKIILDILKGEE